MKRFSSHYFTEAPEDYKFLNLYGERRRAKIADMLSAMEQALKNKAVYNVQYKDFKFNLDRVDDEAMKFLLNQRDKYGLQSGDEAWNDIYYTGSFHGLHEFKSAIKKLRAMKGKHGKPYDDIIDAWMEKYGPLQQAVDMVAELKPYIVKGRKPREGAPAKDVYVPPASSKEDLQKVRDLLSEFTSEIHPKISEHYQQFIDADVKRYTRERENASESPWIYERRTKRHGIAGTISNYIDRSKPIGPYPLRSDYKDALKKAGDSYATTVVDTFIEKNLGKLTSIVAKKGDLKSAVTGDIDAVRGRIEGDMFFEFGDGSKFRVFNQIVTVWNAFQPFNRFPTTFHDVVMPDGTKHKKVSEKWMNTNFVGEPEN